jgi:hypothetical protein
VFVCRAAMLDFSTYVRAPAKEGYQATSASWRGIPSPRRSAVYKNGGGPVSCFTTGKAATEPSLTQVTRSTKERVVEVRLGVARITSSGTRVTDDGAEGEAESAESQRRPTYMHVEKLLDRALSGAPNNASRRQCHIS